jgi:hypothetical protein
MAQAFKCQGTRIIGNCRRKNSVVALAFESFEAKMVGLVQRRLTQLP